MRADTFAGQLLLALRRDPPPAMSTVAPSSSFLAQLIAALARTTQDDPPSVISRPESARPTGPRWTYRPGSLIRQWWQRQGSLAAAAPLSISVRSLLPAGPLQVEIDNPDAAPLHLIRLTLIRPALNVDVREGVA